MRLRVEHAEPGTDPTSSDLPMRSTSGMSEFIRQNWWISLVVVALVVLPRLTGGRETSQANTVPQKDIVVAESTPTATLVPAETLVGWCVGPLPGYESQIVAGRLYEPGIVYVVGNEFTKVRCENAAWIFLDEP